MRPRAILGVPGLDPDSSPSERFVKFARMIVSVPKTEADREMEKSGLGKRPKTVRLRKVENGGTKNKTSG
jgi:hypothetical protein